MYFSARTGSSPSLSQPLSPRVGVGDHGGGVLEVAFTGWEEDGELW